MNWWTKSPVASWLRVFVSAMLVVVVADLAAEGSLSVVSKWESWVVAGLVATLPVIANWLNPKDVRYGRVEGDATH